MKTPYIRRSHEVDRGTRFMKLAEEELDLIAEFYDDKPHRIPITNHENRTFNLELLPG